MDKMTLRNKITGMFFGIAIGDALGMPWEMLRMNQILSSGKNISRYYNPPEDHKFHGGKLQAGEITDDTQLSLVVAESLIACRKLDMDDLARRHVAAMDKSTSGWGEGTRNAIQKIKHGASWKESGTDSIGNGVMMKISPYGALMATLIADGQSGESLWLQQAKNLGSLTHTSRLALASGWIQAELIRFCLLWNNPSRQHGEFRKQFLLLAIKACLQTECEYDDFEQTPVRLVDRLINLFYNRQYLKDISSLAELNGNKPFLVYNSLPMAYACFLGIPDKIQSLYNSILVGGDTDTNASIVGALLGAKNGLTIFPRHLIDGLREKELIQDVAERFCDRFVG